MSVVLVVKVSEGLVIAADSAATLSGRARTPDGKEQEGILKTFFNAKKLLQIGDFPIGVLTWGTAFIGPRTIESLVREWEHDNSWISREMYCNKNKDKKFNVKDCAQGLLNHLTKFHEEEYGKMQKEARPKLGLLVAGYSENEFFPEIWRFVIPIDNIVYDQRPDINGKPNFGASWFGLTEPLVRLHFGRDDQIIRIFHEKYGIPEDEIKAILSPLEYPVPFAQMPLQDAIEYANYMLNVVIGRFRFVLGPELCGGEIDIAAITQNEFNWIRRKSWKLD